MKELKKILKNQHIIEIFGSDNISINSIQFDSRKVESGDMFIAISGTQVDGHQFIERVIEQGAVAIICETKPEILHKNICYILVKESSKALGIAASNYFDNPSSKIKLVGITGTNGKTSTATMSFNLFRTLGYHVGLLSTVENRIDADIIPSTHTTPDAIQLNSLLNQMLQRGCDYCFMEVSSHSVIQERIAGLEFTGGLFSNITHDHLDFHKTFDAYIKAKKQFFDQLSASAFAITNVDDRNGLVMLQNTKAQKKTYGIKNMADYKAKIIANLFDGLHLTINEKEVWMPLVGSFNAYNLLAVYSIAMELGANELEVLTILSKIKTAEGRFETYKSKNDIVAIVDYAHTPDALKNVLETIHEIRETGEDIITVVGAGGDRDPMKRPEMARISAALSDRLILTSDNPRSEEPESIITQMEAGINPADRRKSISIVNRKEAIKTACALAKPGDIILVAGKGHEKYQEIKGVKHHFDDKEIIKEFLTID